MLGAAAVTVGKVLFIVVIRDPDVNVVFFGTVHHNVG